MQKQTQQGLHLAPLAVTAVVCTLRWLEGARPALETGSKRQQTKKEKKNKKGDAHRVVRWDDGKKRVPDVTSAPSWCLPCPAMVGGDFAFESLGLRGSAPVFVYIWEYRSAIHDHVLFFFFRLCTLELIKASYNEKGPVRRCNYGDQYRQCLQKA